MRDKGPWRVQVPHPTCSSLANSTTRIGTMTHRRRHESDSTPSLKKRYRCHCGCCLRCMDCIPLNRRAVVVEKGDWRQKALLFMQVATRSSYYKERWELLWAARALKRTYSDGLNSIDRHIHFFPDREPCHLGS